MATLRFSEYIGTSIADDITGARGWAVYGMEGADILRAASGTDMQVMVGGSGNDTYVMANNAIMAVGDSAGTDSIRATGIGVSYATSHAAQIDGGRHLLAWDTASGQTLIVLDWKTYQIESITLGDGTFSYAQISASLTALPGYAGTYSWEASGLMPGYTTAEINEAIRWHTRRAGALEQSDDFIISPYGGDMLFGGLGNDTVYLNDAGNIAYGNQGADYLSGGAAADTIFGGQGSDFIVGGASADALYGNLGDDTIYAESGNDYLHGGAGNDTMAGGLGADTINGGIGSDALSGDDGNDVFAFAASSGNDTIADFTPGADHIQLASAIGIASGAGPWRASLRPAPARFSTSATAIRS